MPRQGVRRLVWAVAVLALVVPACGGAGDQAAPTPNCTTMVPGTGGSPSPTITPCVIGATDQPTTSPDAAAGGEEWNGSADIGSSAVYPNGDTCTDAWALSFSFVVDAEGKVQGSGTADLTSSPVCPFPIPDSLDHVEYNVLGDRSSSAIVLRFALVSFEPDSGAFLAGFLAIFGKPPALPEGGPAVTIAIVGTSGQGQGSWQFESDVPPPAVYSATGTISVECATCD